MHSAATELRVIQLMLGELCQWFRSLSKALGTRCRRFESVNPDPGFQAVSDMRRRHRRGEEREDGACAVRLAAPAASAAQHPSHVYDAYDRVRTENEHIVRPFCARGESLEHI